MMIATAVHATSNSDGKQSEQEKKVALIQKNEAILSKFKKDLEVLKKLNKKPVTISKRIQNFLNRGITIREGLDIVLAATALALFIAMIKFDFFPSEEQKRLRARKGPNVGPTGLSRWSEASIINLLTMFQRKL